MVEKIAFENSYEPRPKVPWTLIILVVLIVGAAVVLFGKPGKKNETPGTGQLGAKYLPELSGNIPEKRAAQKTEEFDENYAFDDGLKNPDAIQQFELDEFGEGPASTEVFNIDINGDGIKDRITRSRQETGTAHFYYEYKIELNSDGRFADITPDGFRTIEGAECSLKKLKFLFHPNFQVIQIAREWEDTWTTPTPATKLTYKLAGNKLEIASTEKLKKICNVSGLF